MKIMIDKRNKNEFVNIIKKFLLQGQRKKFFLNVRNKNTRKQIRHNYTNNSVFSQQQTNLDKIKRRKILMTYHRQKTSLFAMQLISTRHKVKPTIEMKHE